MEKFSNRLIVTQSNVAINKLSVIFKNDLIMIN